MTGDGGNRLSSRRAPMFEFQAGFEAGLIGFDGFMAACGGAD